MHFGAESSTMVSARAWSRLLASDPQCLPAKAELVSLLVTTAVRSPGGPSASVAKEAVDGALALAEAYAANPPARWATRFGAPFAHCARASLLLMRALLVDFCRAADDATADAAAAAAYAAAVDAGCSDRRVWQLWAAAAERDATLPPAERKAAAEGIHAMAVQRGVWLRVEQRPLQLLAEHAMLGVPWLDDLARSHPACAQLAANYASIREEGLAALAAGSGFGVTRDAAAIRGRGLALGDWTSLGLYTNGRRHGCHAALLSRTIELIGQGPLRRDAASNPLGSSFLSLLAPGARLRPHCGPTNARLRVHLPLLVPPAHAGECVMRVGLGPPRRWEEGQLMVFDDSFEHEVWNETALPRLVLIVDIWHPGLDSEQKRVEVLDPPRAERYLAIVRGGEFDEAAADPPAAAAAAAAADPPAADAAAADPAAAGGSGQSDGAAKAPAGNGGGHGGGGGGGGGIGMYCAGLHANVVGVVPEQVRRELLGCLDDEEAAASAAARADPAAAEERRRLREALDSAA